jgi:hemoglobin
MSDETEPKLFERLGGEAGVRRLVDRFYDHMDARPDCAPLRQMHPADLTSSREKLWMFLVGWSGGPQLYVERHGHPRLRARHLPFAVDTAARDQWLSCFDLAMDDCEVTKEARQTLVPAIARLADHMRNTEG